MAEQETDLDKSLPESEPKTKADQTEGPNPEEDESEEETLPPLTYIDFLPQCLGTTIEEKEPDFAEFGTVVEQANQWLISMPQFCVYKCETISVKLTKDFKVDNDATLSHISSNGKNVYVRMLRLWLIPKVDASVPVQQISYVTILPDHSSGNLSTFLESMAATANTRLASDTIFHSFDTLKQTAEKLNKHLQVKPLSGKILTVETITLKCHESSTTDKLIPEGTVWREGGANSKVFLYGFRIFYVLGQPAFDTIGFYDEIPDIYQSQEGLGLKVKFATFGLTVSKAAQWLKSQQGIRVVNVQSLAVKLERKFGSGPWVVDPICAGYIVSQSLTESRYTKVLRITYVKEQKLETPSPYASVTLTSRLFVPNRIAGKSFETFSKTMLRAIKWLNATRIPLFACETATYQVSADSEGQGFNDERTDFLVNTYSGRYTVVCIRLYFPSVFQEPPPEIEEEEEEGWAWACVVS